MKNLLKRLFCKHTYEKIRGFKRIDYVSNVRYTTTMYKCSKCNKVIEIDSFR